MRRPFSLALLLLLAVMGACGESDEIVDPAPPAALFLALPASVVSGEPFALTVTPRDATDQALDFTGTITLSVDRGVVSPAQFGIDGLSASAELTITGAAGSVTLTAALAGVTASAGPLRVELRSLAGDGGDAAADAIPDAPFQPIAGEYATDHPDFGDLPVSTSTLVLLLAPGATVAQANALIGQLGATVVGGVHGAGILILSLQAGGYAEMSAALALAAQSDAVELATLDVLLGETHVPASGVQTAIDWEWDYPPSGGNWGMERIRAPQMWNLKAAAAKWQPSVSTLIYDVGFADEHVDLNYFINFTPGFNDDHGTHVAGTIAARWDKKGVDGLNPFASISTYGLAGQNQPQNGGILALASWAQTGITGYAQMVQSLPDVRLVNVSLGFNWYLQNIDVSTNLEAQNLANGQGGIFNALLLWLAASGSEPLLLVAAGNDSDTPFGLQNAIYGSSYANAALNHGNPNILVVESVRNEPGVGDGEATRSAFSNVGGHLSAPGTGIRSTTGSSSYTILNGTSMATPHVTGLAGFLLALDSSLTNAQLIELLKENSLPVSGDASPRIDAFASAIDIDRIRNNEAVLTLLCDIDDGSPDGNLRVKADGTPEAGEDLDGDGGPGDGVIDMSDFRRWRDWLLQVEDGDDLNLDGTPSHPKFDVNGNGDVESAEDENLYPRGDFNGNGFLGRLSESYVPGSIQAMTTDLLVLQSLFDDPDYDPGDLPGLIESADLSVSLGKLFAVPDVEEVTVWISEVESEIEVEQRTLQATDIEADGFVTVFTLPFAPVTYEAIAIGYDGGGGEVTVDEDAFLLGLGEDEHWTPPGTLTQIRIEADRPDALNPGESFELTVRAGHPDESGEPVWEEGLDIELAVTGGFAAQTTGITDAQGEWVTLVTFDTEEFYPVLTIFVTASDEFGFESVLPVQIKPNRAVLQSHRFEGNVGVNFFNPYSDFDHDVIYNELVGNFAVSADTSVYVEYSDITIDGDGSADADVDWTLSFLGESLDQVTWSGGIELNMTLDIIEGELIFFHGGGSGSVEHYLTVVSVGNPMEWTLVGTFAGEHNNVSLDRNNSGIHEGFTSSFVTGGTLTGYENFHVRLSTVTEEFSNLIGSQTHMEDVDYSFTFTFFPSTPAPAPGTPERFTSRRRRR